MGCCYAEWIMSKSHASLLLVVFISLPFLLPLRASGQRATVPRATLERLRTSPDILLSRVNRSGAVDTVSRDVEVTLRPGDFIVAVPPDGTRPVVVADSMASNEGKFDIAVPILTLTRDGPRTLLVTVETGGGLTYVPDEEAFVGVVHIGLKDMERPNERFDLQAPMPIQIIAGSGAATPDLLQMDHTHVPLLPIRVVDAAPPDSFALRILYTRQDPVTVSVPIRRVALAVTPARARINAFGLERATFAVPLPTELSLDSVGVTFSAAIEPDPVTTFATRSRPAITRVRSRGSGSDTLTVTGPHYLQGAAIPIDYVFPWRFALAAMLGGLLGGTLRMLARSERTSHAFLNHGVTGVLLGLLVAVLYAVGANVQLPIVISGPPVEAVILGVAAVAAFTGTSILGSSSPKPAGG
jgi:hypothetical protein